MKTLNKVNLETNADTFVEKAKAQNAPPIYKLTPEDARSVLEQVQGKYNNPKVSIEEKIIETAYGKLTLQIVRPKDAKGKLQPVLHFHGGGWILGSFKTHARFSSDVALGTNKAVVFVEYSKSPEARFPVALEECYTALKYVAEHGNDLNLDTSHISILGDSVGGNLAIATTLLTIERKGPKIKSLVLFYPVTSADLNSESYELFKEGPWLTKKAMEWFWNAYEPSSDRSDKLLSPINASLEELKKFPPTLLITDENDVLRDEGEAFAKRLAEAGAEVTAIRVLLTLHDFLLLNPIALSTPTRAGLVLANQFLITGGKL